jgi:hypothetical protein
MGHRSIYMDLDIWEKAKKVVASKGKSLNELLFEYVCALAEGGPEAQQIEYDYANIKKDFVLLVKQTRYLVNTLKELGTYEDLTALAFQLGLRQDLSNMEDIIPKLVKAWAGDPDSLIVFIDLLETSKRKREVAELLNQIRAQKYLSREGQGDAVQSPVAAAHSVQGDESVSEVREQRADEDSRPEVS